MAAAQLGQRSSFKHRTVRLMVNYRLVIVSVLAVTYILMHYLLSNSRFVRAKQSNENAEDEEINVAKKFGFNSIHLKDSFVRNDDRIEAIRNLLVEYDDQQQTRAPRRRYRRLHAPQSMPTAQTETKSILNTLISRGNLKVLHVNRIVRNEDELKFDHRSPTSSEYNLKNSSSFFHSQTMQDRLILHLLDTPELNKMKASLNGLFVEAGAFDGETWSNTLHLERFKGWTGLLIEPSAENYRTLLSKNRNAYSINSCLCAGDSSLQSAYIEAGPFGVTTNITKSSTLNSAAQETDSIRKVTCHPLAKILTSFFQQHSDLVRRAENDGPVLINYMSLDIEGNERGVLESFPWSTYRFNQLTIEYNQNKQVYEWLVDFMKSVGYVPTIVDDVWFQDVYFAHESIYHRLNLSRLKVSAFI